jgi:hypothetical protein
VFGACASARGLREGSPAGGLFRFGCRASRGLHRDWGLLDFATGVVQDFIEFVVRLISDVLHPNGPPLERPWTHRTNLLAYDRSKDFSGEPPLSGHR